MKPSRFHYEAPTTVGDVVGLLAEYGGDAKLLAGGQSLVPLLSLRLASFDRLIDLNRVADFGGIERANGHVAVGALVRQAAAEHDDTIAADVPLMARALPQIGNFQIRNRGTICGSLAYGDPAAELPAVALALDATLEVTSSRGSRTIAAGEFFKSRYMTALAGDELLTAVRFPVWEGTSGFAIEEVSRRRGDPAICGAVCGVTVDGDSVVGAAIGLFGVGSTPVRASAAEQALIAGGVRSDLDMIGHEAAAATAPPDDLHASGRYRKQVAAVVVRRALTRALEEAHS